jgi:hypothetical protein
MSLSAAPTRKSAAVAAPIRTTEVPTAVAARMKHHQTRIVQRLLIAIPRSFPPEVARKLEPLQHDDRNNSGGLQWAWTAFPNGK